MSEAHFPTNEWMDLDTKVDRHGNVIREETHAVVADVDGAVIKDTVTTDDIEAFMRHVREGLGYGEAIVLDGYVLNGNYVRWLSVK